MRYIYSIVVLIIALIPNAIAIYASAGNIKNAQHQIEIAKQAEIKTISDLQEIAAKLDKLTLKFELEVGEEEKVDGSDGGCNDLPFPRENGGGKYRTK